MLPLHYVNKDYGILIPKTEDGRVIFVLPYHEKALVGTTDKTWQNITNDPKAPKEDLWFLCKELSKQLYPGKSAEKL